MPIFNSAIQTCGPLAESFFIFYDYIGLLIGFCKCLITVTKCNTQNTLENNVSTDKNISLKIRK